MGIKRFVVDAAEEITVIYHEDDAIDAAASDLQRYRKTGDLDCLQLRDGETPTEFVIHALSARDERRAMTRAVSDSDAGDSHQGASLGMAHEAYRLGCREIRNVEAPGDSFAPRDLPLTGSVEREIGLHVMRISGMLPGSNAPGDDLGK